MSVYRSKDIFGVLKGKGVVVTPHRFRMLSYLMYERGSDNEEGDDNWYRASRIYMALLEEGYFISLSSVYKNLCLFRSMGLIDPDGRDL
jgi:Fe2+ or Zn2+ uptake regulation protein